MSLRARLDAFLFAPVDARIADLFRAGLALMLVPVFWPRAMLVQEWVIAFPGAESFYRSVYLTPPWLALTLLALALFALGWRVRWMALVLALLLLPSLFMQGYGKSRQVLYVAMLAISLLRCDFCFGLFSRDSDTRGSAGGPIWPVRLVQLQLSLLYFVNAAAKTTPDYLSGQVLIDMSRLYPNFKIDLSTGFLEIGPLAIPAWLCAVGTVLVEFALALGFWFQRTRIASAILGVTFHGSLKFIVRIGWLDWASMFLYLSFLLPFESRDPER